MPLSRVRKPRNNPSKQRWHRAWKRRHAATNFKQRTALLANHLSRRMRASASVKFAAVMDQRPSMLDRARNVWKRMFHRGRQG